MVGAFMLACPKVLHIDIIPFSQCFMLLADVLKHLHNKIAVGGDGRTPSPKFRTKRVGCNSWYVLVSNIFSLFPILNSVNLGKFELCFFQLSNLFETLALTY